MLESYVPIFILFLIVAGFAALVLGLSSVMGPQGIHPAALEPYESGIVPEEPARRRFPVRFALIAMLFLVFDIEAVFFFPWAVVFKRLGVFALVEMFLFIGILLIGYIYAYKKGALNWE